MMTAIEILKTYALTTPIFLGIDLLWLGVIAKNFYQEKLGPMLRDPVNWPPAIIFYLLFPLGVIILAVSPAKEAESLQKALFLGALFGFYTYATYDLSNLATLKNWPLQVTITDIIWGTFISTVTAGVAYLITS